MTDLDALEREINDLALREEVEAQMAEYEALMQPAYIPGLGLVSGLAARMLAEFGFGSSENSRCHRLGDAMVHVKPWCHCPKRRSW